MTDVDRFHQLVTSLPSLRRAPGCSPWDANQLLTWLCSTGASHGEALAARFVLGVWNVHADWVAEARDLGLPSPEAARLFDMFEAASVFDAAHRHVISSWFEAPFFP